MPDTPGSLGIAISEAIEAAVTDPTGKTRYSLGSVLNHVLLHQTIIGLEAKKQLQTAGEKLPDIVIGCAGGGSNFAGLAFPFAADKINGANIEIMPDRAGGLPDDDPRAVLLRSRRHRLHDAAAAHALAGPRVRARSRSTPAGCATTAWRRSCARRSWKGSSSRRPIKQTKCYESAMMWAQTEGTICAPETSHAIAAVIDEAVKAREEGKKKVILFNYSGHGLMDLVGYDNYLSGKLTRLRAAGRRAVQVHEGTREVPEGRDAKDRSVVIVRRNAMRHVVLVMVLLAASVAAAQETQDELSESPGGLHGMVGASWDSQYIWRGFNIFRRRQRLHVWSI